MVGHVETSTGSLSGTASAASIHTLRRIDSMHSVASDSEHGPDVDVHHTIDLDGEVADKALSPGIRRAFADTPILLYVI
jgi:hypothetical protein